MKTLIVSDTHFGVKNNSMTWLQSQLSGFKEIISYIKNHPDPIEVVHCGDLFESRSSISPYVVYKVNEMLRELCSVCHRVFIIGGNHDYYSPEENDLYNITSLDFIDTTSMPNLSIISQDFLLDDKKLMIPWFTFHNPNKLQRVLDENLDRCEIIYTHTDLKHPSFDIDQILRKIDRPIVTGHVHQPNLKNLKRATVGSCFALDFTDHNTTRGYYLLDENCIDTIEYHELTSIIAFYRLYNEEIFTFDPTKCHRYDRAEIYIDSIHHSDSVYKDRLKELESVMDVTVIINSSGIISEEMSSTNFDIDTIIDESIPDHLKEKFAKIKCLTTSNN